MVTIVRDLAIFSLNAFDALVALLLILKRYFDYNSSAIKARPHLDRSNVYINY